jgi:hypothetical protein
MRGRAAALLLLAWGGQGEPVEEARRDLGPAFTCEAIARTLVFASAATGDERAEQIRSVAGVASVLRERAIGAWPKKPLRICVFASEKELSAFVRERYQKSHSGSGYYDLENRLIAVRARSTSGYLPRVLAGFWLRDELGVPGLPDWIATGLGAFAGQAVSPPALDPSVVWLQKELSQGGLPAVGTLVGMRDRDFRLMERFTIHEAEAKQLFSFLDEKRALRGFFEGLRATVARDPTGREALEGALILRMDEIERQFVNRLKALPWADQGRLRDEATRDLGEGSSVRIDAAAGLAVSSNADEAVLLQCIENVRKLRDPLRGRFGMAGLALPVQGVLLKDGDSYRGYMGRRYPDRAGMAGYYDPVARRLVADLGSGTPVFTHEFCHAVFSDDFGVLPPWLSEGLACLFENYRLDGGAVIGEGDGKTGLVRRSVQGGRAPSLARMMALTDAEFHGEDRSSRYTHASAVCLYLQEKGLLSPFYAELRKARGVDPTGEKSLQAACGKGVDAVDEDFRAWIMAWKPR